jgi:hypothetical protein
MVTVDDPGDVFEILLLLPEGFGEPFRLVRGLRDVE